MSCCEEFEENIKQARIVCEYDTCNVYYDRENVYIVFENIKFCPFCGKKVGEVIKND